MIDGKPSNLARHFYPVAVLGNSGILESLPGLSPV